MRVPYFADTVIGLGLALEPLGVAMVRTSSSNNATDVEHIPGGVPLVTQCLHSTPLPPFRVRRDTVSSCSVVTIGCTDIDNDGRSHIGRSEPLDVTY